MKIKRAQARSVETREALFESAQRLFGQRGYANVSIDQIATRAGATKGAFYHHFDDKLDLLTQLTERIEAELGDSIRNVISRESDPLEQLAAGCELFLEACADPQRARIALVDAPSILGWQTRREIDSRHGLGLLIEVLERGMKAGRIERQPADALAHLILGAALEAGMLIAHSGNDAKTRRRVRKPLLRMLEQLSP